MEAKFRVCLLSLLVLGIGPSRASPNQTTSRSMIPVPRDKLCVTEGRLQELKGSRFAVAVPKMRAFVAALTPQVVEARFTYLGPSGGETPLGSGEIRRQFGLKLRAQDGCNVVYAMWRIEPESSIVVSIKTNPGMHSSSECGNRGYQNIKPKRSSAIPSLRAGDFHSLVAQMNGSEMRVSVDSRLVWEGDLGPEALAFDGPIGLRTDNGRFEFELFTPELGSPIPCQSAEED